MPTLRAPLAVLPDVGMSQSTVILGALAAGFVVFLAIQNRLGVYWSLLTGGGAASAPAAPANPNAAPSFSGTAPGNTGAGGTLIQPQGPGGNLIPFAVQPTPGMQGN